MNKNVKNILEAQVTDEEFSDLFADDIEIGEYLTEYPSQNDRYHHLADLAVMRGCYELVDFFRQKSGYPPCIDDCR